MITDDNRLLMSPQKQLQDQPLANQLSIQTNIEEREDRRVTIVKNSYKLIYCILGLY